MAPHSPSNSPSPASRRRRWPWILAAAAVLLVAAALLVLPRLLDPESYRDRIEAALHDATGWNAELGAIDFSVLHGLSLTVTPASLSAPDGGSKTEVERIDVSAQLWPLLSGELRVGGITLVRPSILLVRETEDAGWILPGIVGGDDTPTSAGSGAEPSAASSGSRTGSPAPAETSAGEAEPSFRVSVERIHVENGSLRLEDRAVTTPWIAELDGVDVDAWPEDGRIAGSGTLTGGGRIEADRPAGGPLRVVLDGVSTDFLLPFTGEGLLHEGGAVSGTFEASLSEKVTGRLTGTGIRLLEGTRPFESFAAEIDARSAGAAWRVENLRVQADGVTLEGSGPVLPAVNLALRLSETSLDDALRASEAFLPLPLEMEGPGTVQADMKIEQPEGGAPAFSAKGTLGAARFVAADILPDARNVRAAFTLSPAGALEIRVQEATVAGGPLTGTARLDSVSPPGKLTFDGGLRDAALGTLLGGLVSDAVDRVQGPTGLDAGVTLDLGRETIDARALGGRLDLDSRSVTLPGWDLEGAVRRKLTETGGALGAAASLLGVDSGGAGGDTASPAEGLLDRLGVRIDFDRFPWGLERLDLGVGDLSAAGAGTFDPVAAAVDLKLTAKIAPAKTEEMVRKNRELRALVGDDGSIAMPLEIRGPLLGPSIGVELRGLLSKGAEEELKDKAVRGLLDNLLDRKKK